MIKVIKTKVYVQGKATTDPTLIGLAVLDSLESNKESIKQRVDRYIEDNELRRTKERENLVEIVSTYDVFDTEQLIDDAERFYNISRATSYGFIKLLQDAEIITKKEHLFI